MPTILVHKILVYRHTLSTRAARHRRIPRWGSFKPLSSSPAPSCVGIFRAPNPDHPPVIPPSASLPAQGRAPNPPSHQYPLPVRRPVASHAIPASTAQTARNACTDCAAGIDRIAITRHQHRPDPRPQDRPFGRPSHEPHPPASSRHSRPRPLAPICRSRKTHSRTARSKVHPRRANIRMTHDSALSLTSRR